jgi:hypothetical protein
MELRDIKYDKKNYRKHSDKNKALIRKSIEETGLGRSVVIDSENELIAGNGVVSQLPRDTKIKVVETDGSELVVVKRTDLKTADEKRKKLALMDNSASDKVEWEYDTLTADFDLSELEKMGVEVPTKAEVETEEEPDVDFSEELLEEHNYVVLYFDNSVDWLQAESIFGLKTVKALDSKKGYKKQGIGRVIRGVDAIERIKEQLREVEK